MILIQEFSTCVLTYNKQMSNCHSANVKIIHGNTIVTILYK